MYQRKLGYNLNSAMHPLKHGLSVAWATVKWRVRLELGDAIKNMAFVFIRKILIRPLSKMGFGAIKPVGAIYKFIAVKIVPERQEVVRINDCELMIRTGGEWGIGGIGQCLLFDREYEPETTRAFKEMIKPDMRVVDIGANMGYYTVLASKLVGEGGMVWAFEPEARNFCDLLENIELNNLENIIAVQKAISDDAGIATLYISKTETGEHSLVPGRVRGKQETIEVETIRLDSVIKERVDFIKTDTEGNELAVLKGARNLMRGRDVKLVIEFFPEGFGLAGYTAEDLWDIILDYGFRHMYLLDEWKHKTIPSSLKGILNYTVRHGFSANVLCSKTPIGG